jgi:hypothetical protein
MGFYLRYESSTMPQFIRQRYHWLVFLFLWALILAGSIAGYVLNWILNYSQPRSISLLFEGQTLIYQTGLTIFGIVLSLTAFRRNQKWAWALMWYLPLSELAGEYNLVWSNGQLGNGDWFVYAVTVVSIVTLTLCYRRFFSVTRGQQSITPSNIPNPDYPAVNS